MENYGSTTFDAYGTSTGIGVIPAPTGDPQPTDPRREYAVGVGLNFYGARNIALGHLLDDIQARMGPWVYGSMPLDPEINSSLDTLVDSVFSDGIMLAPRIMAMPENPPEDQPSKADIRAAADAAEFVQRSFDRVGRRPDSKSIDQLFAIQFKYGLTGGHKLGEPVLELAEGGPDAGRYVMGAYKLKEARSWSFVVDRFKNVVGYLMFVPTVGPKPGSDTASAPDLPRGPRESGYEAVFLEPDKFALYVNEPESSDPRGRSALQPCWAAWTLKVTLMPEWHRYLQLFAMAKVLGKLPERMDKASFPGTGGGPDRTPAEMLADVLEGFRNAATAVVPHGTEIELVEGRSDGQPFKMAIDAIDKQLSKAILGSTRATNEAEYGSRADSQTSKDLLDLKVKCRKRDIAHPIERLAHWLLEVNFGEEYADKFCPVVSLGDTGQEDFPLVAAAYATLYEKGILDPTQRAAICRRLRLPMPSEESVRLAVESHQAAQQQAGQPGQNVDKTAPANQSTKVKPQEAA